MENMPISPLGFGCSSVMGKKSKGDSLKAMEIAYNNGVTHFDIARSYGFGVAENILGEFLKGKRDLCTVTSKFGVVPPELTWKSKILIPIAREVSKKIPYAQKMLRRKSGRILENKCFNIKYARKSLDQSLLNLKIDYLDFYLLHEPNLNEVTEIDDLRGFMDDAVQDGKIKEYGVALMSPSDENIIEKNFGKILQFEANINSLDAYSELTFHNQRKLATRPFSGGDLSSWENILKTDNTLKELKLSPHELSISLSRYMSGESGTVICSMYNPAHIKSNVEMMEKIIPLREQQVKVYKATLKYLKQRKL